MISFKRILLNRNLTCLWLGQIISQSADSIYMIGLLWLTLELSGSESVTGMVAMFAHLPAVLLSIFAGVAVDRFNRRRIMLAADLLRTVVVLVIPAAFFMGFLSPAFLAVNTFFLAIASTFFNPARDSMIPSLVERKDLIHANSLIQTSWQLALLIGPAIAGYLLHLVGKIHMFTADAFFYLLSFVFVLLIKVKPAKKPVIISTGLAEIKAGLQYVLKQRTILPLLLISMADNLFIMGPAIVGTPVFVKSVLHEDVQVYALIQACYAIGMLTGTFFLLKYGKRYGKGKILLAGMFLDGVTFIPLFFADSVISTAIIIIIHSMAIPMLTVPRAAIVQEIVPGKYTGRIFALINMAVVGMSALSAGITGVILELLGVQLVFLIIGIGGGLCGVLGWLLAPELRRQQ